MQQTASVLCDPLIQVMANPQYVPTTQQNTVPPVVHVRLQIQLQHRPQLPEQQQPLQHFLQQMMQQQYPSQQFPQQQTPQQHSPQLSPQQSQSQQPSHPPAQQIAENATLSQVIQLLQVLQQLRSPTQPLQLPLPPQQPQSQAQAQAQAQPQPQRHYRSVHQVFQRRYHPYCSHSSSSSSSSSSSPSPKSEPAPTEVTPTPLSPPSTPSLYSSSEGESPLHFGHGLDESRDANNSNNCNNTNPSKRVKPDYTHDFKERFATLVQASEHAQTAWREYRTARKACTVVRAPCIRAYREFCEQYGGELHALNKEDKYEKLGSLTRCGCSSA